MAHDTQRVVTDGAVEAVHRNAVHALEKLPCDAIRLVAGLGVEGDAHAGATVQHRSRVARDPAQPNRRQVHLIASELYEELRARGFAVDAGGMGENVTTRGVELLTLPTGTRLHLGADAVIELTGLRNPCRQLDDRQPGLMAAVLGRAADGTLVRRAGVMATVVQSGTVRPDDAIGVRLPRSGRSPLRPV
ncbi:MAG TPA: MOSC domain-containing protein [Acidimicrobiia bacterium]|nr:MOSC domain-containing protein [Acidimicrobiia bacterium]